MRQDEYEDLLAGNAVLQDEIDKLKSENARHIERIKELTTELEFYKNRFNKAWGEE